MKEKLMNNEYLEAKAVIVKVHAQTFRQRMRSPRQIGLTVTVVLDPDGTWKIVGES